jgi:signal peptidase I
MSDVVAATSAQEYSRSRLLAGILGRTWLWFVVGCVVITLLPLVLGWRSYVVQSGSMEPRIRVGDVVIADRERVADELLGRVTVFAAPGTGRTTVHRTIAVNEDGTLTTKGDANARSDSSPVPLDSVEGMGRLLVRWVGLPLVWISTGQWVWLGLLALSLVAAALAAARDREDPAEDPDDDERPQGGPPPVSETGPLSTPAPAAAAGVLVRAYGPIRGWLLSLDLWPVPQQGPRAAVPSAHLAVRSVPDPLPAFATGSQPTDLADLADLADLGGPPIAAVAVAQVGRAGARHAAPASPSATPGRRRSVAGHRAQVRTGVAEGLFVGLQRADLWPVRGARRPLPATAAAAPAATWRTLRRALDINLPSAGALARTAHVAVLTTALLLPVAGAGFMGLTRSVPNVWAAAASFASYPDAVAALSPWMWWRMDETGGATTAADSSGNGRTGTYLASGSPPHVVQGQAGAFPGTTPNRAVRFTSPQACVVMSSSAAVSTPAELTEIVWFKSTSTSTGRLLGLERPRTGVTSTGKAQDRHLYLDGSGRVWFGINAGTHQTLSSGPGFNDGQWHMAAATLGPSGMKLYVDAVLVGTNPSVTTVTSTGWWRAGCGNIPGLSTTVTN